MRFRGKAVSAMAFLIATTVATGCPALNRAIRPQWSKCERVWSQSDAASLILMIYGEGGWLSLKRWEAGVLPRRAAITGAGGLSTVDISGNNGIRVRDGTRKSTLQNPYRCEQLPARALASATAAFKNLATGLSAGTPPARRDTGTAPTPTDNRRRSEVGRRRRA